jgi:hypothetical protein
MSATIKAGSGLEPRPVQVHEFDLVSGGGVPLHRPFANDGTGPRGDFSKYVLWGLLEPITSPLNVTNWVGKLGYG